MLETLDQEEVAYVFHTTRSLNTTMVATQELRTTRSTSNNPDTTSMVYNPERVLRNNTHLSFHTVYAEPGHTRPNAQNSVETVTNARDTENEGPPSVLVQEQNPTSIPPGSVPKLPGNAKQRAMMQQMALEEATHIRTSTVKVVDSNVVEETLSDAFHVGTESANVG